MNSLPLNGRNFVQLAILAPGVSGLDYAQPGTINTGKRPDELRPGGTAIQANGALSQSNQVLLDGIDNTEMISQTFIVRPAVEGIQEFKVLTNNAGAEYGRSVGAVVVVTIQVGQQPVSRVAVRVPPQRTPGCAELLRPSRRSEAAIQAESVWREPRRSGATSGITAEPTFFFANYEGYREVFGDTQLVTVPVAQIRTGDFQGVVPNGIYRSADHARQSGRRRGHPRPVSRTTSFRPADSIRSAPAW